MARLASGRPPNRLHAGVRGLFHTGSAAYRPAVERVHLPEALLTQVRAGIAGDAEGKGGFASVLALAAVGDQSVSLRTGNLVTPKAARDEQPAACGHRARLPVGR